MSQKRKRLKLSIFKGLSLFLIFAFCPDFADFGENKCIIFISIYHFHIMTGIKK